MTDGQGIELFIERCEAEHPHDSDGNQAIDWAALLQLILPLIIGCFAASNKTLLPQLGSRVQLAMAIWRGSQGHKLRECYALADTVIGVRNKAKAADVAKFTNDLRAAA